MVSWKTVKTSMVVLVLGVMVCTLSVCVLVFVVNATPLVSPYLSHIRFFSLWNISKTEGAAEVESGDQVLGDEVQDRNMGDVKVVKVAAMVAATNAIEYAIAGRGLGLLGGGGLPAQARGRNCDLNVKPK
eukprot:2677249-Amphidinium_carterae.1